ncbi:proline-rich protein 2-like [Phalacrocorax carbo]|uniref:proline-rich protein 2-like n=1 Tax=Phalacrocorax carbo TaxID=9209 RepID=UPI00311A7576
MASALAPVARQQGRRPHPGPAPPAQARLSLALRPLVPTLKQLCQFPNAKGARSTPGACAGSAPLGRLPAACSPQQSGGFLPSPIPGHKVAAPPAGPLRKLPAPSSSSGQRRSGPLAAPPAPHRTAPHRTAAAAVAFNAPPASRRPLPPGAVRTFPRPRVHPPTREGPHGTGPHGTGPHGTEAEGAPRGRGRRQPRPQARAARQSSPPGSTRLRLWRDQAEGRTSGAHARARPGTGRGDEARHGRDGTGNSAQRSPAQPTPALSSPDGPSPQPQPRPGKTPPEASHSPALQTSSGPSWGGLAEAALP